jgi:hypothetical protein
MRSNLGDIARLKHMLEAIDAVETYLTGVSY